MQSFQGLEGLRHLYSHESLKHYSLEKWLSQNQAEEQSRTPRELQNRRNWIATILRKGFSEKKSIMEADTKCFKKLFLFIVIFQQREHPSPQHLQPLQTQIGSQLKFHAILIEN